MAKGTIDPTARNGAAGKMITPEQLAASGTEHGHQAAFFQWIALHGAKVIEHTEMLFAVPNGGDRRASVAASLKAEGVKSGVPDVCWPVPKSAPDDYEGWVTSNGVESQMYAGLWIELKKPDQVTKKNGGRSDAQVKWAKALRAQGYAIVTAYGWQAMAWVVWQYSREQLPMPPGDDALQALPTEHPPVVEMFTVQLTN